MVTQKSIEELEYQLDVLNAFDTTLRFQMLSLKSCLDVYLHQDLVNQLSNLRSDLEEKKMRLACYIQQAKMQNNRLQVYP